MFKINLTIILLFIIGFAEAQNNFSFMDECYDSISVLNMLEFEKKANNDSNKVYFKIYNIDLRGSENRTRISDCINNYNVNHTNLRVTEYLGTTDRLMINVNSSDNKLTKITARRSKLFLFTSNRKLQLELNNLLFFLHLEVFRNNNNGVISYTLVDIENQDEFCWKLNQILHFIESNKELFKEEENSSEKVEEKPKFSINLSSTALLSGNLKPSTGPYGNQLGFTQQPIRFDIDFQYWIKKFRLGLGLGFSQFYCNNSLNDSSYQIPWANSLLGNNNHLNIYYKNIKEKVQFQNYNFSFNLGYSEPLFKNRLRWDVDAGFQFILPFVVQSQLIQGEFSYRGQIDGIVDELRDIPVLGLVENNLTSRGKISTFQMNGWGLTLETGLAYNFKNFECKVGIGYNFIHYTNDNYLEKSIISQIAEDFKSPLFSVQSITSHYFMLQFGLGYSIK